MKVAGIDGCKYGWIIIKWVDSRYAYDVYPTFIELMRDNKDLDRILIDIPIGLSSKKHPRTIDKEMRKELQNRRSTVFNAPCRAAVYEKDNEKARQLNIQIEGKSLSIQSLFIREKIREVDQFLVESNSVVELIESHPEICFKHLNQNIVQTKKSKSEGIDERLKIIENYDSQLLDLYKSAIKIFKRSEVKKDDIVDAMVLCLANRLAKGNTLSFLTDSNTIDEEGIKMRVAFYNTNP